jgi:hypothetical protein
MCRAISADRTISSKFLDFLSSIRKVRAVDDSSELGYAHRLSSDALAPKTHPTKARTAVYADTNTKGFVYGLAFSR